MRFQILTRFVGAREDPLTTLFYTALVGTVAMTAVLPLFWDRPTKGAWATMAAMGAVGLVGQLCLIRAFTFAKAKGEARRGNVSVIGQSELAAPFYS